MALSLYIKMSNSLSPILFTGHMPIIYSCEIVYILQIQNITYLIVYA